MRKGMLLLLSIVMLLSFAACTQTTEAEPSNAPGESMSPTVSATVSPNATDEPTEAPTDEPTAAPTEEPVSKWIEADDACTWIEDQSTEIKDGMVYETAISITEGECSDDEMASEIGTMRSSVRELIAKVAEATDKIAAFNDELDLTDNDGEVVNEPVRDNKKFYIVASIIGGAALIIAAIIAAIV